MEEDVLIYSPTVMFRGIIVMNPAFYANNYGSVEISLTVPWNNYLCGKSVEIEYLAAIWLVRLGCLPLGRPGVPRQGVPKPGFPMEVPKVEAPNEVPNPGGPKGFGDEVQTTQNSIF